jgi:urea carboxylase system permease
VEESNMSNGSAHDRADSSDLARFGYKQRLERSLGLWSAFALSYGWVAILTGISALFFFGFVAAGPAFFWAYPVVGAIQLLTALCLAEMAGQVPVEGSMYQWARHVTTSRFIPWIAGWFLIAAMLVTITVIGPTLQQVLTLVNSSFQLVGGSADIGTATTHNGAINAIILGGIALVVITTVNVVGVRWTARVTNVIVSIELTACILVCVALAAHITRGPGVVFQTHGTGVGQAWGWFGAFLIATIAGAYVFFGFENAAMLAEETHNPRKNAPRAMLRSLGVSIIIGILLAGLGLMAVKNINAKELGTSGFPYLVQSTIGHTLGNIVLIAVAISVTGAVTAIEATGVRIIFAMARDGRIPFSRPLAHVSPRLHTPVLTTLFAAAVAMALLVLNYGNPRIFSTLGAVAILLFYICYLLVIAPMLVARLRGQWPREDHGEHFSLGRWGLPINIAAVLSTLAVIVNVAWPRAAVYGNDHWYLQYGALVVVGLLLVVGVPYYLLVQRHRTGAPVAEHLADVRDASTTTEPVPKARVAFVEPPRVG